MAGYGSDLFRPTGLDPLEEERQRKNAILKGTLGDSADFDAEAFAPERLERLRLEEIQRSNADLQKPVSDLSLGLSLHPKIPPKAAPVPSSRPTMAPKALDLQPRGLGEGFAADASGGLKALGEMAKGAAPAPDDGSNATRLQRLFEDSELAKAQKADARNAKDLQFARLLEGATAKILNRKSDMSAYEGDGTSQAKDLMAQLGVAQGRRKEDEDVRRFGLQLKAAAEDRAERGKDRDEDREWRKDEAKARRLAEAQARADAHELKRLALTDRADAKATVASEKAGKRLEDDVQSAGKDLEDVAQLKGDLEVLKGEAGNKGGMAGLGLWDSMKPGVFQSAGDTKVTQAAWGAVNKLMKLQSGSAVSPSEAERKMRELGLLGTEDQAKAGIARLIKESEAALQRRQAKYRPEVVKTYQDRGGTTLDNFVKGDAGSKPKTVIQNGVTYTLNEQTGEYE